MALRMSMPLRKYREELRKRISSLTRSPFWKHLLRASWVIVGISLLMLAFEQAGWLERFETAGIDAFNLLQTPHDPTHVVIVGIDDDDYGDLFKGRSPLDANELRDLIEAIALGKPKVIGVDLDTSSDAFRGIESAENWPPIVWAEDAIEAQGKFRQIPALGGSSLRGGDGQGIAGLPQDPDGITRRYRREFQLEGGGDGRSFPWVVVQSFSNGGLRDCCQAGAQSTNSSERGLLLNFSGERFNFSPLSARFVLKIAREPGWADNGPLRNRIVLLGGFFRASRDTQITPIGKMAGVQLMAQAIETELRGGGIRPLNEVLAFILDILAGTILVWFSYRFRLSTALTLSLLAIPFFSLTSSYLAFASFGRWFNFVPVIIGVLIHELYHHAREYHHLLKSNGKE